jgi:nicotinamidase-related amidase
VIGRPFGLCASSWVAAEEASAPRALRDRESDMPTIDARFSTLIAIDFQMKLTPAIDGATEMIANARRLIAAAAMLSVPTIFTEQNPSRLGPTVADLSHEGAPAFAKMSFDACAAPGFPEGFSNAHALVLAGCEAHVCVLQTALGLIERGRRVYVVSDAVGSRRAASKQAALRRMDRHGVEIVITEMVAFEWLGSAEHPRFREVVALIK